MLVAGLAVAACGGESTVEEPTGALQINLTYPSEHAEAITGSVHVWVLESLSEVPPACAALVAQSLDPYDATFVRWTDEVFLQPEEPTPVPEGIPYASVLAYVEAVDVMGTTHLAGCAPAEIAGATQTVSVSLSLPGTFDCSDPATDDGAPCDDGELCTVGEVCERGNCVDGSPRDCTHMADDCNAGSCDEILGCVPSPLPDSTACEDGLFCTTGDVCTGGICSGVARDCTAVDDECNIGYCDESLTTCLPDPVPYGTPCALYCVVGGTCQFGSCYGGSPRDCTWLDDQCNLGVCDEDVQDCVAEPQEGDPCEDGDGCTMDETCSSVGVCEGGVLTDVDGDLYSPVGCPPASLGTGDCRDDIYAVNPGATEGPYGDATCYDSYDNDCDGDLNQLDFGCQ